MFTKIGKAAAMAALLTLALSGCAGGTSDTADPAPDPGDGYGMTEEGAQLMVADSQLGEIVVDAEGMTVYMFDSDTQGAGESTCEGSVRRAGRR